MEDRLLRLRPSVALEHQPGLIPVMFWDEVSRLERFEIDEFHWPTDERWPEEAPAPLARVTREGQVDAVFNVPPEGYQGAGPVVRLQVGNGNVWGAVAAGDRLGVEEALTRVSELWPRSVATEGEVPVTFWSYSPNGPRSISRKIAVAPWDEVAGNYAGDAREHLEAMMQRFRPSHGGQLVLWQGVPGTGKTWALRALASEWREWADFHYITDPDVFFGQRADYMLDVLVRDSDEYVFPGGEAEEAVSGRWRVLLMEDTGEILAADAKEKTGQALSRLLNVVDGLIGQGLRILVLVTTNEELKRLHPAVSRPGRCAARIEFGELGADEAVAWGKERGVEDVPHERATLAELFALAEDWQTADDVPLGFVQ